MRVVPWRVFGAADDRRSWELAPLLRRSRSPPREEFRRMSEQHRRVEVYDTTLRDGSQLEGISLTVEDKLRIAEQLDWLGVHYIEGGWPGANPKDDEFFRRAPAELRLGTSTLVAFGSTPPPPGKVGGGEALAQAGGG